MAVESGVLAKNHVQVSAAAPAVSSNASIELIQHCVLEVQASQTRLFDKISRLDEDVRKSLDQNAQNNPGLSNDLGASGSPASEPSSDQLEQMNCHIAVLEDQNRKLREAFDAERQARITQEQDLNTAREDSRRSAAQHSAALEDRDRYRQLLANGTDKDEPLDGELSTQYEKLFKDVEALVRKLNVGVTSKTLNVPNKGPNKESVQAFYKQFVAVERRQVRWWLLQEQIFWILKKDIFDRAVFGITDSNIENSLAMLEKNLFQGIVKDDLKMVQEWRKQTIQCIQTLNKSSVCPRGVGTKVWDLCSPLLAEKDTGDQLVKSIEAICDAAFALALRLRGSKSDFRVSEIGKGRVVSQQIERDLKVLGFERSDLGDEHLEGALVQLTIVGALVKIPYGFSEELVLVQAQVVCKPPLPKRK